MNLVERIKNIIMQPRLEWAKIAVEPATPQSVYVNYVMILAAIGPVAIIVRTLGAGAPLAIVSYVITLAVTFLLAWIVDALAPTFGGQKNFVQSLKLVAYSYTAAWLAGVFQLLGAVGGILGFIAAIYSWYTLYLGLPVMKGCPSDKAVGYTIVVVICGVLLGALLGSVLISLVVGGSMMGAGSMGLWR
jgi:hypothetical protein